MRRGDVSSFRGAAFVPRDVRRFLSDLRDARRRLEDLPEEASDFCEGVRYLLDGMESTAERSGAATERMRVSLDNVLSGVRAWETGCEAPTNLSPAGRPMVEKTGDPRSNLQVRIDRSNERRRKLLAGGGR